MSRPSERQRTRRYIEKAAAAAQLRQGPQQADRLLPVTTDAGLADDARPPAEAEQQTDAAMPQAGYFASTTRSVRLADLDDAAVLIRAYVVGIPFAQTGYTDQEARQLAARLDRT